MEIYFELSTKIFLLVYSYEFEKFYQKKQGKSIKK